MHNGGHAKNICRASLVVQWLRIYLLSGKVLYNTGSPAWCSVMTWKGGLEEGREALEGVDICIVMSGLHCCVGETNITL